MEYLIVAPFFLHAVWVFFDAHKRRGHTLREAAGWAIGTLVLWLFIVPLYVAKRNLRAGETREGGAEWNFFKSLVVLWTIIMLAVGVHYILTASEVASTAHTGAEQTGAAIGVTLGVVVIAAIWFFPVVGALLLGLVLRKTGIVEKGPTGPLAFQRMGAAPPALTACPTCGNAIVKGTPCRTCSRTTGPERKLHGTLVVAGVMASLLVLGLLILGVLKGRNTAKVILATPPSEGVAASPIAPAPHTPGAADRSAVLTLSRAIFKGGVLEECEDLTIHATPSADAGTDWREKLEAKLRKIEAESGAKDKRTTMLQAPCTEQFTAQKPFASCTLSLPPKSAHGVLMEASAKSLFYLFATVSRSDAAFKKCVKDGGKWVVFQRPGSQEAEPDPSAVVSDEQDALQFGKPTVRDSGFGMTRVMVQARNVADRPVTCVVTATFMQGDTILGTANGTVDAVRAGGVKTAELMTMDRIRGYDTVRLETGGCF